MANLLLADSQPLFNEALAALFGRGGDNRVVGCSSDPADLLAKARQLKPDLIMIDSGMALGRSPTLVETLRADLPATKIVLLLAELDIDVVVAAIRAGAVGVVGKTSGARTILRTAQAAIDGEGAIPRAVLPEVLARLVGEQRSAETSPLNRLSPRERQVLALLSKGWDNAHIGSELFISPNTVRTHIQNILEKLEMHSKLEAATFAMQRGVENLNV